MPADWFPGVAAIALGFGVQVYIWWYKWQLKRKSTKTPAE